MGATGRRRAEHHFDAEKNTRRILDITAAAGHA